VKKVLLINPPSPFLLNSAVFPPLGLLYVAAELERWDCEVKVVDYGLGNTNFVHWTPDFIGITGLTSHVPWIKASIPRFREMYPEAKIVVGGPHFSNAPQDGAKVGADTTCIGDGEASMISAVHFPHSPIRQGLINVDEWPAPARHLLDLSQYHYEVDGLRATPIVTARGCPFRCAYCSRGPSAHPLRYRNMDLVRDELYELWTMGFRGLQLYDDELNIATERLGELAENLRKFRWRGFVRSNLFTHLQAELMRDNGCVEVCCGVESGSDRILQTVDKRAKVSDADSFMQICRDTGLRCKVFLILGLPGESEETAAETKAWLLRQRPNDFDITIFTPYPGSRIHDFPEQYDIQIHESYWDTSYYHKGTPGEYHSVVSTSHLSRERITELRDGIERDVRNELGLAVLT